MLFRSAQASQLTIFQRTPNFSVPAHNGPVSAERKALVAADTPGYRAAAKYSRGGIPGTPTEHSALLSSPELRRERFEAAWAKGELFEILGVFNDIMVSPAANEIVAETAGSYEGYLTAGVTGALDRYVDSAALAGLTSVRIVHGKGTGALRREVGAFLEKDERVRSFRTGTFQEGELGVTIVELMPVADFAGDRISGTATAGTACAGW